MTNIDINKNKNALIVFAKPPIAGLAKTRLIPAIGEAQAAEIHGKLLIHTLSNVVFTSEKDNRWDTHLWCSEKPEHPFFQVCQRQFNLKLHVQSGNGLGERMAHAMRHMLNEYEKVCIIGADCPVIDRDKIHQVFASLNKNDDVVITPAEDGGYVLLAIKQQLLDNIFTDIEWGKADVYQRTLTNLRNLNLNPVIQPTLWDVDEPADLKRINLNLL